jgi:hypothetical protein
VEQPVKPEIARGLRRLLPNRKRSGGPGPAASRWTPGSLENDFDPVEFAEFLEADEGSLPIDPDFKEALRERLWSIVREHPQADTRGDRRTPGRRPRRS